MHKFVVCLFCIVHLSILAQKKMKFERFTIEDGLPGSYILDIHQDKKGFLWFGMRGGACRYDGFTFKEFKVQTKSGNLALQTWVTSIAEDAKNRLWIGETGQFGLLLFDSDNECFIDYSEKLELPDTLKNINVNTICCDNKGVLWIGIGSFGLIQYNTNNGEVDHLMPSDGKNIPYGIYRSIIEDEKGEVWIATSAALCKFNSTKKTSECFNDFKGNGAMSVYEDAKKNILVAGKNEGLYLFNKIRARFEKYPGTNNPEININGPDPICEDKDGRLWVGSNNGICVFDNRKNTFQRLFYNEDNPNSICSNIIKDIFLDKTGNIWFGTSEGVCKLKNQQFKTYRYSSNKNSISQNRVQCIAEGNNNTIWIATPSGIDIYNRKLDAFTFFAGYGNSKGMRTTKPPITFCNDKNGMWIGTYEGGLNFYNYRSNRFEYYIPDNDGPKSLNNNIVFSLLNDKNNILWIGTWGDGLYVFNRPTDTFSIFLKNDTIGETMMPKYITCLHQDTKGIIWVGTLNGFASIEDPSSGSFQSVITNKTLNLLRQLHVYSFLDVNNGNFLWIATNSGLLFYDVKNRTSKLFDEEKGLPSSLIFGIIEDKNGNLWVSSSNGLIKAKTDYASKDIITAFQVFTKSDGIQGNEFLPASFCKLHDGSLTFGGTSGFTLFHPDSLNTNPVPPTLAFTNLEIKNSSVNINEMVNGQVVLKKSITNTKNIILNYKNNNFSIEFVALHFNQPNKNSYAYKLNGFEDNWQTVGHKEHKANYMNLKNGEYEFVIKAANSNGTWNNKGISMGIKILPPWWKTWWFNIIWIVLFSTIIVLIVKLRTHNLQKQKQVLEQMVLQRTSELNDSNTMLNERKEELEQQMNQMAIMNKQLEDKSNQVESMARQLHEADQSKLRFFANISHEFRTPLTLIIGPLHKFLQINTIENTDQWNRLKNQINLVLRNANRLSSLIAQIIDFRKIDQNVKKTHPTENNIVKFITEISNAFSAMAETKRIQLIVKSKERRVKNEEISDTEQLITHHSSLITQFWFDPDIMEKILYNLISNAIKYTPEDGEIYIQLKVKSEELRVVKRQNQNANSPLITHHSSLIIKITDTGIGIKPENIDKIFTRFYNESENGRYDSVGIGLAYTKELVKLHNGKIRVESEPNKGTTFTLVFPFEPIGDPQKEDVIKQQQDKKKYKLDYTQSMIRTNIVAKNEDRDDEDLQHEPPEKAKHFYTILIVEDNIDLRRMIKNEFKADYNIREAENGQKAWEIALKKNPDIIISDVMMPVMDGFELCRKIKSNEETSHIPVILLTAKSGEEETITGLQTGADDYITKPFKFPLLKARIDNILKIRKQLHEKFTGASLDIKPATSGSTSIDERFLHKATHIVTDNINDPEFSNDMFIQNMAMSRTVIYKKIKALTGQSLSEFIRTIRLRIAAKLLLEGIDSVSEVAYKVGFKRSEHFTRYFTQLFGVPPTEYIRNHGENAK